MTFPLVVNSLTNKRGDLNCYSTTSYDNMKTQGLNMMEIMYYQLNSESIFVLVVLSALDGADHCFTSLR